MKVDVKQMFERSSFKRVEGHCETSVWKVIEKRKGERSLRNVRVKGY